jgi:serine/threonine-protein kinase
VPLSKPLGKHAQPRIACVQAGCVIVWDEENAGAHIAFLAPETGEIVWQRTLGAESVRPALAVAPWGQVAIAWYEDSKVLWTSVGKDGIGKASLLTRVSGHQPYPAVVAGLERGQWWVAFRDFEAGHFESFVVRAQCPDVPVLQ